MVNVSVARYALGVIATLVTLGSLGFSAVGLRRRFLPEWSGPPARLTETLMGVALLVALLEALGAVGLFKLTPIVAGSVIIGLGTHRAVGGRPDAHPRAARVRGRSGANRLGAYAALAAAALVAAEWASPTLESFDVGIRTLDSVWYHLPWAASFAHSGQITSLRFTDVEYLTAFYPASAELFHGLGIVFFARDTLSPALNLFWVGLVLLGAYCVGRPRGVGALTTIAASLALLTPMMDFSQAGSAANDIVGVAFVLGAAALVLDDRGSRFAIGLAGVSAGLAVATKLSMLAAIAALTIGVLATAPQGRRRLTAYLWLVPLVIAGGFWYLRNLIAVGNPLPWVNLPGLAVPATPQQAHTAFSVARYLTSSHAWSAFLQPGLASGLGPWWAVILACTLAGPLLCLLPGADARVRMLGLVALASLAAYVVTPETAAGPPGQPLGFAFNLRYAAPALTLSLVCLPLAPVFSDGRRRAAIGAVLTIVIVATISQARLWPSHHVAGALLLAVGVVVAVALIREAASFPVARRAAVLAVATALLLAGAAAGYPWQRHYLRGRYVFMPGVSYMARVWALFRQVHHSRVGIVGTFGGFFSYPLYGLDLSNTVDYVARRGAHGSFTPIGTCPEWRRAVNAGHFHYLVTTPGRDPWHPKPLLASPEGSWTGSDPGAQLIYSRAATGQPISVYELRGPLDPSRCPAG